MDRDICRRREKKKRGKEEKRKEKGKKRKEKIYILGRTLDFYPLELIFSKEFEDPKSSPGN